MKISIIEIINTPNAIIQKFGRIVFNELDSIFTKNPEMKVELSFEGLENMTTGFCNASIGALYKKYGNKMDNQLKITGLEGDRNWTFKINRSKNLGLNPQKVEKLDSLVADLFN